MKPPMHCNVCGDTKCTSCGATKGGFVHIYYGEDVCYACAGYLAQDATITERKRIIAKARMRAEGFDLCGYPDRRDAFNEFANELEAECE